MVDAFLHLLRDVFGLVAIENAPLGMISFPRGSHFSALAISIHAY
jgi:hypothetical protein